MKQVSCIVLMCCSFLATGQTGIIVLGIAQDGGFPHIGCQNECKRAWEDPALRKHVVALAVMDEMNKKWWLFEATPDIVPQLQLFSEMTKNEYPYLPEGIFITHAHIGHYTGLMQLGRETLGARGIKVYVLPKMAQFLEENGPWSQLVTLENIRIERLKPDEITSLSDGFQVMTYQVPHRDEFSETAGFHLITDGKKTLFIPDVNKWEKWEYDIVQMVANSQRAFIDGSFLADGELQNRSIAEVPHPFVSETIALFEDEPDSVKSKVFFIHFNHTNPLLWDSGERINVISSGFNIAIQGRKYN